MELSLNGRALGLTLLFSLGSAQVSQAAPLTWQECAQEVVRKNPDLAAAQQSVLKARALADAEKTSFFPQLSAEASVTKAKDSDDDHRMGLSARQPLFSGGRNTANVRKSAANWEAAEAALAVVQPQVGFDLRRAFAQLLYGQQQIELAESITSRRQENVRLVELRYDAGRENKGSFLRSRASYLQSDFEVSQSERALRVAQRQLARVMGRDESEHLTVAGDLQAAASPDKGPDFRALARQTPVRLQAEAQARSSEAGIGVARSELFPQIDAVAGVRRQGSHWPPDQNDWSGGLTLSFPFWPGGRNLFDVKAAQAESRRGWANARSVYDQAVLELEQSFAGFQDAVQRMEVQRQFLTAAEVRAEIARSQYSAGLLSFQDWDQIENDLISTQKAMLVSKRDAMIAEADWQRVAGKGAV